MASSQFILGLATVHCCRAETLGEFRYRLQGPVFPFTTRLLLRYDLPQSHCRIATTYARRLRVVGDGLVRFKQSFEDSHQP